MKTLSKNKKGEQVITLNRSQINALGLANYGNFGGFELINSVVIELVNSPKYGSLSIDIYFSKGDLGCAAKVRRFRDGCKVIVKSPDLLVDCFLGDSKGVITGAAYCREENRMSIHQYHMGMLYRDLTEESMSALECYVSKGSASSHKQVCTYFIESVSNPKNIKVGKSTQLKYRLQKINYEAEKINDKYRMAAVYVGDMEKPVLSYLRRYAKRDARHVGKTEYFSLKGKRVAQSALAVALNISNALK